MVRESIYPTGSNVAPANVASPAVFLLVHDPSSYPKPKTGSTSTPLHPPRLPQRTTMADAPAPGG
jgi:hypothetical protein